MNECGLIILCSLKSDESLEKSLNAEEALKQLLQMQVCILHELVQINLKREMESLKTVRTFMGVKVFSVEPSA